jgi:toxin CptA
MSIAVSAIVHPSRLLQVMVGIISTISAAIGIGIATGVISELPFGPRSLIAIFSIFLAVFGFYHGMRHRKTIQIDISSSGQLRLTEVVNEGACRGGNWPHVEKNGQLFCLMMNSTIWPHLLLLRLQAESGLIQVVLILPDCVSKENFRAMSVACRWVATHSDSETLY